MVHCSHILGRPLTELADKHSSLDLEELDKEAKMVAELSFKGKSILIMGLQRQLLSLSMQFYPIH